jgi:hypothetical protein
MFIIGAYISLLFPSLSLVVKPNRLAAIGPTQPSVSHTALGIASDDYSSLRSFLLVTASWNVFT